MKKSILTCLTALALLPAAAPPAATANGAGSGQRREEVVARVKKAHAERRRVRVTLKKELFWFREEITVTGRVGGVRDEGFAFEPDDEDDAAFMKAKGMAAVVPYESVASVRYPSKVKKFFKGVGIGAMGVGALFVVMPVYGVWALVGDVPDS